MPTSDYLTLLGKQIMTSPIFINRKYIRNKAFLVCSIRKIASVEK